LSPENLRNFYAGADVVAIPSIPSRRFVEPWGLVANEAMNQRCAVVTTDAVGAAAGGLVRDGRTGLVVPAGDPGALAGAIRRLRDDPDARAEMGKRGHEAARERFHWPVHAQRFVGRLEAWAGLYQQDDEKTKV
jgi:glycosyltransferase involved in cell wall biosynthesis